MNLMEDVEYYCRQRSRTAYLLLVIYLVYSYYKRAIDPQYWGLLNYVDLTMHEAGHMIWWVFGEMMWRLGGTIMQLLVPTVFAVAFLFQKEFIGVSFAVTWLGQSLLHVSMYVGDARARVLPLLGGNRDGHDWFNILTKVGLLPYDTLIAAILKVFAGFLMTAGVFSSLWLLWLMITLPRSLNSEDDTKITVS